MVNLIRICFIFLLLIASDAAAQTRTFFSPGIKFGYQSGSGMFAGLELSYSIVPGPYSYGAVLNLDLLRSGGYKIHFGLQGSTVVGVDIGPTYAKERDKRGEWGYSASLFGLIVFMPFYTYTDLFGREIHESGMLIKIPLQVKGPEVGSLFNM